jgi:MEMO1 family protein
MSVRAEAVSGLFYPSDQSELSEFLEYAEMQALDYGVVPKIIISPHAGYVYSGECASKTMAPLKNLDQSKHYKILLLGPSHRVYIKGAALSGVDFFKTPLGTVAVDTEESLRLEGKFEFLNFEEDAHRFEHSLEVQLPFLQKALKNFSITPVVYGKTEYDDIEALMEAFLDGEDRICIVSSDLSHYHDEKTANRLDGYCVEVVERLDVNSLDRCEACGIVGIAAAVSYAVKHNLKSKTLDYRTSAKASGDYDRVVGYGGFIFYEDDK